MISILHDDDRIMRLLLQRGCSASKVDSFGNQAIHWASVTGNANAVATLFSFRLPNPDSTYRNSVSFNEVNNKGESALFLAVREGHLDIVKLFYAQDLYPLATGSVKRELLDLARSKNHEALIQFMEDDLREGMNNSNSPKYRGQSTSASPEAQKVPDGKSSPSHYSDSSPIGSMSGAPSAPLLQDSPILYSDFWSSSSSSPSAFSPMSPFEEKPSELRLFVEAVIEQQGADSLFRLDQSGFSAIHVASATGDVRAIQSILHAFGNKQKKVAQANLADVNGTTPLSHAIAAGGKNVNPSFSSSFLFVGDLGAQLFLLFFLFFLFIQTDIITLLLENGADPLAANKQMETPLHVGAKSGSPALSNLLVRTNCCSLFFCLFVVVVRD